MAQTHIDAFPLPTLINVTREPVIARSSPDQGVVHTRVRSQIVETTYECRFVAVRHDLRRLVELHYEEHCNESFTLRTQDGDATVMWAGAPQFTSRNNVISNGVAVLRLVQE